MGKKKRIKNELTDNTNKVSKFAEMQRAYNAVAGKDFGMDKGITVKDEPDIEEKYNNLKQCLFSAKKISINDSKGLVSITFPNKQNFVSSRSDIMSLINNLANVHKQRYEYVRAEYLKRYYDITLPGKKSELSDDEKYQLFDNKSFDEYVEDIYQNKCVITGEDKKKSKSELLKEIYVSMMEYDMCCVLYQMYYMRNVFCNKNDNLLLSIKETAGKEIRALCDIVRNADMIAGESGMDAMIINDFLDMNSPVMKNIKKDYNVDGLSDKEAWEFLNLAFDRDGLRYYVSKQGAGLIKRKAVLKKFFDEQIIDEFDFKMLVDQDELHRCYEKTKNDAFLSYMYKENIVHMYTSKEIDRATFVKNITLRELLNSHVSKEEIMYTLVSGTDKRIFPKAESAMIWRIYELDLFTTSDMKILENLRYIHPDTILKNYKACQEHKIGAELGEYPIVSEERLLKFFTPDLICKELLRENSNPELYIENLRPVFEKAGRNIADEITDYIKSTDSEEQIDQVVDLYKKGVLGLTNLKDMNVPEEVFINLLSDNYSEERLIDFYNNECISQDTAIDFIGEYFESKSFDLIKAGMNANIISGFYSTKDLIEMLNGNDPKLTASDLFNLRADIKTGLHEKAKGETTLLDMYLNEELSYAQLFDLQNAGVISEQEANEINDKYSLGRGLEALKKTGLKGQSIDNLNVAKFNEKQNNDKSRARRSGLSIAGKEVVGMDDSFVVDLYTRLGANDIYSVDADQCPIFDGYMIIPVIDRKIGFLEGNGRTYILPLKIILEQINNPKGELDIIGNATSRSGFNSEKKYVSSTNHSKNWVRTTIKKALEMSPNIDDKGIKQFLKDNDDLIKASQKAYESKKQKEIE